MKKTASIFSKLSTSLARFKSAQSGNVAVMFAIAIVPIVGFVGAAIDYSRANNARTAMQAALDSTALMLSKDVVGLSATDLSKKAQDYFNALYKNSDAKNLAVTATYTTTGTGSKIVMNGSAKITTDFMKVVGYPTMDFGASSTTVWGSTRMRVAMVLDNTGSMASNGKLTAMQSAAKNMITTLSGYNKTDGDVYISIVPFTKDVNVGTSNVNANWLNWSEWEAEPPYLTANGYPSGWSSMGPGATCPFTKNLHGFTCMDRPATLAGANSTSTIPSSGTYAGMICPSVDSGQKLPGKTGIFYNGCYTSNAVTTVTTVDSGSHASCNGYSNCTCSGNGNNKTCVQTTTTYSTPIWRGTTDAAPTHSTWKGCVNDRDQDYDTKNTAPIVADATPSTRYYAEQWTDCLTSTVTGMSNNWSALKTQIDNMIANGNTNQSVGFAWGWQTLNVANGPFMAPAKPSGSAYTDYVVLLSDGMNTQNRWSTSSSSIDARQAILCQNIKNSGATIFTIQVNISNQDPQSTVLKNCASGSNFQMITSASQTADAFQNILTQIAKLRISQ